jgi:peptide/nickel transport system permease protein
MSDTTAESIDFDLPTRTEQLRGLLEEVLANSKLKLSLGILVPIIIVCGLGSVIAPYDPTATHVVDRFADPGGKYLLGTDHLGRDLLSRVIIGGQVSLLLGFSATGLALTLGVPVGLTAGYLRGRVDEALMRLMDLLMSIPTLLLGLLILSMLPPRLINIIAAIGIVYTPRIARVVRSATLSVRSQEFVLAARARGESKWYVMFREILPNILPPIVVEGSIRVGFAILIGTSLSFLGIGAQPPNPDWGYMISVARQHMFQSVWFLLWPSLALGLTIFSMNMLGDGLRDVLDTTIDTEEL